LDEYIIGQGKAKQAMACAVYNHYARVYYNLMKRREALSTTFPTTKAKHLLDKSNILLLGPSGSGKVRPYCFFYSVLTIDADG
jgi:ATP-dependent Clp protease ATP-binding subunit ClpX